MFLQNGGGGGDYYGRESSLFNVIGPIAKYPLTQK